MTIIEGVQKEANRLYQIYGEIKASLLVDAAKKKTSPAHDAFEWDDKIAGHEYRLIQARTYLKKITVFYEDRPEKLIHIPISVISDTKEGTYKPVTAVIRCRTEYERAFDEMLNQFKSAKKAIDDFRKAYESENKKGIDFKVINRAVEVIEQALIPVGLAQQA